MAPPCVLTRLLATLPAALLESVAVTASIASAGRAYRCPEGYTPLMVACHRGRCGCRVGKRRTTATVLQVVLPCLA